MVPILCLGRACPSSHTDQCIHLRKEGAALGGWLSVLWKRDRQR